MCAVGWEPNPAHTAGLAGLEAGYRRCGWRVVMHTETGVAARQGEELFVRLQGGTEGASRWQHGYIDGRFFFFKPFKVHHPC